MEIRAISGWLRASLYAVAVICLTGCVNMESATETLKGQDISVVVARLGYPSDKREMLGHTIYRWNTGNPYGQGWGGMYCNLDIVVDRNDKIESGNWEGNNGGCSNLANRLR